MARQKITVTLTDAPGWEGWRGNVKRLGMAIAAFLPIALLIVLSAALER